MGGPAPILAQYSSKEKPVKTKQRTIGNKGSTLIPQRESSTPAPSQRKISTGKGSVIIPAGSLATAEAEQKPTEPSPSSQSANEEFGVPRRGGTKTILSVDDILNISRKRMGV